MSKEKGVGEYYSIPNTIPLHECTDTKCVHAHLSAMRRPMGTGDACIQQKGRDEAETTHGSGLESCNVR